MEKTTLYAGVLPTLEMYEAIDRIQKPVIASVNGFAVGGGKVLQVVCDLTIAKQSAVFRQVGPMMGSFDAGYGTWYLEDLVGKKKAKEMWFLNPKMSADEALAIGLINKVVPDDKLKEETRKFALEIADAAASRSRRSRPRSSPATAASAAWLGCRTTCCSAVSRNRREQGALQVVRREAHARPREVRTLAMRAYLTLHEPAKARAWHEQGLWRDETFYHLLAGRAGARPAAVAARDGSRAVTWAELQLWADAIAEDLAAQGLVAGDRVSLWMSNRLEAVATFVACARQGYACNPSLHRTDNGLGDVNVAQALVGARAGDRAGVGRRRPHKCRSLPLLADVETPQGCMRPTIFLRRAQRCLIRRPWHDADSVRLSCPHLRHHWRAEMRHAFSTIGLLANARDLVRDWATARTRVLLTLRPDLPSHRLGCGWRSGWWPAANLIS